MPMSRYVNLISAQIKNLSSYSNINPPNYLEVTEKYKVKKGDTLYDLAKEYGTTIDAIAKASGVKNKNKISIGQELVIPGKPSSPKADTNTAGSPPIPLPRDARPANVTATPDKQTGAGGDYSQAVKSTKPASGLTTRNVTTVPVDKYGNLMPTGPEAAAKAKTALRASEIDAWTKPQWKSPARTSNPLPGPNGMTGTSGRAVASPIDPVAAAKATAAQRVVGSAFDALAANDRGSNMTTSAASLEAQKLAKKLATKKLEAQKNEIIKVPANSYQPETRAAQSSRIDNLKREMAKRSEERKKRTDLQTAADAVAAKK